MTNPPNPPAPKKRGPKPRTDWQETFLAAYSLQGIKTRAAKAANVDPSTVDLERQRNEDFALAYSRAYEEAADNLEAFAHRWGTTGLEEKTERFTYDADGNVASRTVTVTSNVNATLLIFMLKAMRPTKYRENLRVENTGAGGGPIRHEHKLSGSLDEFYAELDRLATSS